MSGARLAALDATLSETLADDGRTPAERARLVRLMNLFATLPPPPDPIALFPDYAALREVFVATIGREDGEAVEEAFLALYCHVHGHEAPYTRAERCRVDQTGGYWCHAGGLSPILKAGAHITRDTVSADFGAGNGLQGLLVQWLDPHAKTVQIEIASRMVTAGRHLQAWLGIPEKRVEWRVADVCDESPRGMNFVYLYRPVRPEGEGLRFYENFAAAMAERRAPVIVFSVADCLRPFLDPRFEVFYGDGHLTCYRLRPPESRE